MLCQLRPLYIYREAALLSVLPDVVFCRVLCVPCKPNRILTRQRYHPVGVTFVVELGFGESKYWRETWIRCSLEGRQGSAFHIDECRMHDADLMSSRVAVQLVSKPVMACLLLIYRAICRCS